uniref:Uncharacterized protein n=1 Tax=Branchiostoma floridae TaxID=7739 RepID=C3Z1N1_BRAFL|eukprot:XP_002597386.1 hypothetical protein BRAFLDRAFT_69335 [Branchiostoma floridae]
MAKGGAGGILLVEGGFDKLQKREKTEEENSTERRLKRKVTDIAGHVRALSSKPSNGFVERFECVLFIFPYVFVTDDRCRAELKTIVQDVKDRKYVSKKAAYVGVIVVDSAPVDMETPVMRLTRLLEKYLKLPYFRQPQICYFVEKDSNSPDVLKSTIRDAMEMSGEERGSKREPLDYSFRIQLSWTLKYEM